MAIGDELSALLGSKGWTRGEDAASYQRDWLNRYGAPPLGVARPDGTEHPLPALLVEAGLARIHTKGADLPDGTRRARFEHGLRSLEKSARLAGRGGWAQFAAQNAARDQ